MAANAERIAMSDSSGIRKLGPQLPVWAARASSFFLLQGAFLLVAYAVLGFDTDPDTFPNGLRLDPIHAAVHLVWGAIGTWIGFRRPEFALGFIFAFSGFYIALAALGTFAPPEYHCGMQLRREENTFHWIVGPLALALALVALLTSSGGKE